MNRKLIEEYCKEILKIEQEIQNFIPVNNTIFVEFKYNENLIYAENIHITLFDLISFVYSKVLV